MKHFKFFILIIIAVALFSSNAFSYKQFLPDNTNLIVEIKIKDLYQSFSKVASLFSVSLDKYKKFLDEMNKDMKKEFGIDIVSPDLFSMTGIDPEKNIAISFLDSLLKKPTIMFIIAYNDESKIKDFINNKFKIAAFKHDKIKEKTEIYKGYNIYIIEKEKRNYLKNPEKTTPIYEEDLVFTFIDNYFLIGSKKGCIIKAIDNRNTTNNLANNPSMKELASKALTKTEDIKASFYFNPSFFQELFGDNSIFFSQKDRAKLKPLLDIYNVYGYIWVGFYLKDNKIGMKEVATFNKSHPMYSLIRTIYSSDLSNNKMYKYFPKNGGYGYFAFASDLGKTFDLVLKNFPFDTFLHDFDKMSKEFKTMSGLDIINDFVKKLGKNGGIAFYGIDPSAFKHNVAKIIENNNFLAFLELDNNSSAGNIFSGISSLLKNTKSLKYSSENIEGVNVLKLTLEDFYLFIGIYNNYIIAGTNLKSFSDYLRNIKNGTETLTIPSEVYSEGINPKNMICYFKLYDFLNDYGYLKDAPAMNRVNLIYGSTELQDSFVIQDFAMTFK